MTDPTPSDITVPAVVLRRLATAAAAAAAMALAGAALTGCNDDASA